MTNEQATKLAMRARNHLRAGNLKAGDEDVLLLREEMLRRGMVKEVDRLDNARQRTEVGLSNVVLLLDAAEIAMSHPAHAGAGGGSRAAKPTKLRRKAAARR